MVLDQDRGSLPYTLVHGEALVVSAAWALGAAGVTAVDHGTPWSVVQEAVADSDGPLVLHDALCPLVPAAFLAACARRAVAEDRVVVAVRPVTDTVKVVTDGVLGRTLDRDDLHAVVAPVVLPARVVAALPGLPTVHLPELVAALAADHEVVLELAPPGARRVAGPDDVRLLEASSLSAGPRPPAGPRRR